MRRCPASALDFHTAYSLLLHDNLCATMTIACGYAYREN